MILFLYLFKLKIMISYNNKSPIRYPGGKTRACKILDKVINDYFDISNIDIIISPFFWRRFI